MFAENKQSANVDSSANELNQSTEEKSTKSALATVVTTTSAASTTIPTTAIAVVSSIAVSVTTTTSIASSITSTTATTNSTTPTISSLQNLNGHSKNEKGLPKAMVKPNVLTHVIEGFVMQEANEPFPVTRQRYPEKESNDEPPMSKLTSNYFFLNHVF